MAMERMEQALPRILFPRTTTLCRPPTKALPIHLLAIIHQIRPTIITLRILNILREAPIIQPTPTEVMAMISVANRGGISVHGTKANGVRESIIEAIGTRSDRPPPIVANQGTPTGTRGRIDIKPIAPFAAVVAAAAVAAAVAAVAVTPTPLIIHCMMKEENK